MTEETQAAPSAEVSAPEPLTVDGALDRLNALDTAPEPQEPAATETAEAVEAVEEAEPADAPEPEAEATPDADPEAPDYLHGNARTRLRDGSEVTIGELKKAYDEAKEYRVKQAEFDAKRQEFEAKQAQIAAQEQYFTNTIGQAKAVLEANFPPKPDPAALERGEIDIISFTEQKAKWDAAVEKWQRLDHAQKVQAKQAEHRQSEELKQHLKAQEAILLERIPAFKDTSAKKAFAEETAKIGAEHWGMPAGVVSNLTEAWQVLAMQDAIAYRKLQADKAKAMEKAKDAPPVQQVQAPGRRVSPAEKQATAVNDALSAARARGGFSSVDEALALMNKIT